MNNNILKNLKEIIIKSLTISILMFLFLFYKGFNVDNLENLVINQNQHMWFFMYLYPIVYLIIQIKKQCSEIFVLAMTTVINAGYTIVSALFGVALYIIAISKNSQSSIKDIFFILFITWVIMSAINLFLNNVLYKLHNKS